MSSSPDSPWKKASRRPFWIACGLLLFFGFFRLMAWALPYAGQANLDTLMFSKVVLDREGGEVQILPLDKGLRRIFVPLGRMPESLVRIVIQAEDGRFWWHPGFDPGSSLRAFVQNSQADSTISGASTISMQLARLLYPHPRNMQGKLSEIWEAMQLEARLGKSGVLELYLNLVPFGHNVEGFPAAARLFFGLPLDELGPRDFMKLAVIPRSPSKYDPFSQPEANKSAADRLPAMNSVLTGSEKNSKPVLSPERKEIWPWNAPHFINWLVQSGKLSGVDGRLPVQTALEPRLQNYLEHLLADTIEEARKKRVSNGAALFVRPDTMEIAAWVGSADFYNEKDKGQIDGVTMTRQPGSTLKPFLYALAVEHGFTASTILPDIPTDFGGQEVYTPANFNDQFNGPVRLRQALASSLNVPAVQTLQRLGVGPFTSRLLDLGFASLESQKGHLGLGLALGNAEVSLFELVQAYGCFLNEGKLVHLEALEKNRSTGKEGTQVMPPLVNVLVRDILIRHPDRVLAFGHVTGNRLKFEGAMKTGTSNQFNNIWAVGFTPDLLGGIWMGNFGGQTVVGTADSGFPAGVLLETLEAFSKTSGFNPPAGLETRQICRLSGKIATALCPHAIDEFFIPGTVPGPCDWHVQGPGGTIVSLPQEYNAWIGKYRYKQAELFQQSPLSIVRPQNHAVFYLDPTLPLDTQQFALEANGTGQALVEVDGQVIYRGAFPVRIWHEIAPGIHEITVNDGQDQISSHYEVR